MLPVLTGFCRLPEPGPDSYRDSPFNGCVGGERGTQILKILMVAYDSLYRYLYYWNIELHNNKSSYDFRYDQLCSRYSLMIPPLPHLSLSSS